MNKSKQKFAKIICPICTVMGIVEYESPAELKYIFNGKWHDCKFYQEKLKLGKYFNPLLKDGKNPIAYNGTYGEKAILNYLDLTCKNNLNVLTYEHEKENK